MIRTASCSYKFYVAMLCVALCFACTVCRGQIASADTIQSATLLADRSGWLLAANRLFWTDSLGVQWTEITPAIERGPALVGAFFSPDGTGIAVQSAADGSGLTVARTADKGSHWSYAPVASPFTEAKAFSGKAYPYFADSLHGWIMLRTQSGSAFRPGILLKTIDGGAHWEQAPAPPVGADIVFTDAKHGGRAQAPMATNSSQRQMAA